MDVFMSLKLKFCSSNLFPESPTSSFCETPEHDDEESQRTVDQVDEVRNQVQPEKTQIKVKNRFTNMAITNLI
jgi:hypothetical protein